jgi:hypothetical protein
MGENCSDLGEDFSEVLLPKTGSTFTPTPHTESHQPKSLGLKGALPLPLPHQNRSVLSVLAADAKQEDTRAVFIPQNNKNKAEKTHKHVEMKPWAEWPGHPTPANRAPQAGVNLNPNFTTTTRKHEGTATPNTQEGREELAAAWEMSTWEQIQQNKIKEGERGAPVLISDSKSLDCDYESGIDFEYKEENKVKESIFDSTKQSRFWRLELQYN